MDGSLARYRSAGAVLLILMAVAPDRVAGQDPLAPAPHQFPRGEVLVRRDPVVAAGDEAWFRRQEGRAGSRASLRPISEAIARYEEAARSPDGAEARWKLARALYFRGRYTGRDAAARRADFNLGREASEEAIAILLRRSGIADGMPRSKLGPAARAQRLRGEADAAPALFWAAALWGEWALSIGKLKAARAGAADRIREYATTLVLLDPEAEEGGGYRVLGRLHDQAPKIPFLTGWVSREEAIRNLRLAIEVNSRNFVNRHFLAEALARGRPADRDEAVRIERGLLADAPSPGHLVEELSIQEEARHNLKDWTS